MSAASGPESAQKSSCGPESARKVATSPVLEEWGGVIEDDEAGAGAEAAMRDALAARLLLRLSDPSSPGAAEAPYMKRLFTRVDSRTYTQRLEEWVTAHGGDVGAMRSSASYTQRGI